MFRYLIGYFFKNKGQYIKLALLDSIARGIDVSIPFINGLLISLIVSEINFRKVIIYAFLLMILNILNMVIMIERRNLQHFTSFKTANDMMEQIISYIHRVNYLEIQKYEMSYLTERITNDTKLLAQFLVAHYVSPLINGVTIIICCGYFYVKSKSILMVVLIAMTCYYMVYQFTKKRLHEDNSIMRESQSKYFSALHDQLSALKNIKINVLFQDSIAYFQRAFNFYYKHLNQYYRTYNTYVSMDTGVTQLFQFIVLLVCAIEIMNKRVGIGDFVAVTSYFYLVIASLQYFMTLGKEYQDARVSYKKVEELLSLDQEKEGNKKLDQIEEINIENLSFAYQEDVVILNKFNYQFQRNHLYILHGKNGIGKTTFLNLVTGMFSSKEGGQIRYNGSCLEDIDMSYMRSALISYSNPEFSRLTNSFYQEVIINKQFNGLNELVHDSGINEVLNAFDAQVKEKKFLNLSYGEMKKAEMLLILNKSSDFVILDEPTVGLDFKTKEVILEMLVKMKESRIILVVSHDPDVIALGDCLIDANEFIQSKIIDIAA